MLFSAAGSAILVGLASLGMLLTTEGRAINLLLEPFCLLFLPGIVVAVVWTVVKGHMHQHPRTFADNHDFSAALVLLCTFLVYFAALYWLQHRRGNAANRIAGAAACDSR